MRPAGHGQWTIDQRLYKRHRLMRDNDRRETIAGNFDFDCLRRGNSEQSFSQTETMAQRGPIADLLTVDKALSRAVFIRATCIGRMIIRFYGL